MHPNIGKWLQSFVPSEENRRKCDFSPQLSGRTSKTLIGSRGKHVCVKPPPRARCRGLLGRKHVSTTVITPQQNKNTVAKNAEFRFQNKIEYEVLYYSVPGIYIRRASTPDGCVGAYHAARKVEVQPSNRSYSQLTYLYSLVKNGARGTWHCSSTLLCTSTKLRRQYYFFLSFVLISFFFSPFSLPTNQPSLCPDAFQL